MRKVDIEAARVVFKDELEGLVERTDVELDRLGDVTAQTVLAKLSRQDNILAEEARLLIRSLKHCRHLNQQLTNDIIVLVD